MIKKVLTKIAEDDWQYLFPFLICASCFIASDFLEIIEKSKVAYWSGGLLNEPYRIITTHFIHGNIKHLLANTFGLIFARYCLKSLSLKGNYFFLLIIGLLIPIQTLLFWLVDIFFFRNPMSLAIGLSGILYGINAFIFFASIYGKENFLWLDIGLKKNKQINQTIMTLTAIGFAWSLLPGISLLGHLTGFIAGSFLFLI